MVQNANGEQTNQLATGDRINGGAGTDTLSAKVIQASALNDNTSMAIAAETVGVEKVAFTALTTSVSTLSNATETAEINAKFMNGLTTISSVHSDASLLVTNVNTLRDDGVYANKRNTDALTVRMDHSGNDAVIAESDLTVLIDNDYLLSGATTLSEALYWLLDEKAELALIKGTAAEGTGRLQAIDTNGLMFKIDGKAYTLQSEAARLAGTHTGFVAELQKQLALDIAAGKIPAGVTLALDTTRTDTTGLDGGEISNNIPAIVLSVTSGTIEPTGYAKPAGLTGQYDVYGVFGNEGDEQDLPITVNVELEKVGRGSDGGDLTIGGMATDGKNEWDFSSSKTLEEGVEKFNVKVSGDESQFSSLASLQSTNNTLQTVVVTSATGSKADLVIGNHNTEGAITNALKDVRDFDSTAFANNVTLNASITDESVAKYMNLKDQSTAVPAADNANFAYNFGAGKDTVNLNISKANLAATGSTVREDFSLSINTAAGNDKVTVQIGDGKGVDTDAWHINSDLNRNLDINTGTGDDTVSAKGAGTWDIAVGEGADTVYSDNSGKKAVWVFNTSYQEDTFTDAKAALDAAKATYDVKVATWKALPGNAGKTEADFAAVAANAVDVTAWTGAKSTFAAADGARDLTNLVSDTSQKYNIFKAQVNVEFKGLEVTGVIGHTNYVTTDLDINQAIKAAINSDAVLSKLLVATDGPANTLVVTSLIDGEADVADVADVADLAVTFLAPATSGANAPTVGELTSSGYTTAGMANVLADMNNMPDYDAQFAVDMAGAVQIAGTDSVETTLNIIEGATGNDVIVLSTNETDTTYSNDTVVYKAAFGDDVIVNFTAENSASNNADVYGDHLDFTALGGKIFTAFNSITSTTQNAIVVTAAVATTLDDEADVAALFNPTLGAAQKHVVVLWGADTHVGTVYQVSDVAGAGTNSAAFIGTIDLADTAWVDLTFNNFA